MGHGCLVCAPEDEAWSLASVVYYIRSLNAQVLDLVTEQGPSTAEDTNPFQHDPSPASAYSNQSSASEQTKSASMASAKSSSKPESRPSMGTQLGEQTKSTSLSSSSSLTAGRETPGRQRGDETRSPFVSTTAYTQYGVTETFGPEPHRPSANNPFAYPTTIDHHASQGEGSQSTRVNSTQHGSRTPRMEETVRCPYHGSILQGRPTNASFGQGLSPMNRYIAEGPSERYAILPRADGDKTSTHSGCRCLEFMQGSADAKGRSEK